MNSTQFNFMSTTYGSHYTYQPYPDYLKNRLNSNRVYSAMPSLTSKPNLPNIPGHQFANPYKDDHKKFQIFELKQKTCTEKNFDLPQQKLDTEKEIKDVEQSLKSFPTNKQFTTTTDRFFNPDKLNLRMNQTFYNESYPRILPQWIKHDKEVLKFYGYFNDHSVESHKENYRCRKVEFYYYLCDDTIHIDETKQENSGLPQGYFIKRQRIEQRADKNDPYMRNKKKYLHWKDLNLASNVEIYGKVFRIYDCDDFTKYYYDTKGVKLNEPEVFVPPKLIDDITNIKATDGSTPESRHEENMQNIADYKEYIEVKLKGGHPNQNLKQFLFNDRKVLNFNILWYDEKYDKEEKPYIMNYYLADNTLEIREIKVSNSGKDPYPYLLRKSKLPKKPKFSYCPGLLKKEKESNYYQPIDLKLGNYINIYNRNCLIYDCDEFTKKWYKDNLKIDMEPIRMKKNPPQKVIHPIPPHNGYGSEEDSLLSVYYLLPKSSIKDMIKMFKLDKHILRFKSKLISSVPSDAERDFIILFFCRDDTVQIYETASKNSGRQECKFMERQRVKNPYTKEYYVCKDFCKGSDIYINKYIFRVIESDDYTKKFMIDNKILFRDSDLCFVCNRIREASTNYKNLENYCVNMIAKLDPKNNGYITEDEIYNGFKE